VTEALTSTRGHQIVAVARQLLETEGAEALTMRRLADELGIRAPSLYKHLADKGALEAAIIADGFREAATAFEMAVDGARDPMAELVAAYRAFAAAHPHLYRLMTGKPLPRERLPAGLEARTAAPLQGRAVIGTGVHLPHTTGREPRLRSRSRAAVTPGSPHPTSQCRCQGDRVSGAEPGRAPHALPAEVQCPYTGVASAGPLS
jgi:AcrR family transcriptional regulator